MIEAGIHDGDTVIIQQTDTAENGTIVVADINTNRLLDLGAGGDTITGVSTHGIGVAGAGDGTGQLRILGFTNLEGDGTQDPPIGTVGAVWRCRINFSGDDHRAAIV